MKKLFLTLLIALSLSLTLCLAACGNNNGDDTDDSLDPAGTDSTAEPDDSETIKELDEQLTLDNVKTIEIDLSEKHQKIESFGASGAWWSQYVGNWDDVRLDGLEVREYIARLLFDPTEGIGLNCYRYNIGGGSRGKGSNSPEITDPWRQAYSFETEPGVYDWSRDEAAVWFMNRSVELGVDEIVMFVNSPLERLTYSGNAYGDASKSDKSNLPRKNYDEFAKYVLDVAEHFKGEGLPIKFISPINEPQWDWTGGQEGCHYDTNEVVDLLKVFVEEIEARDTLDGVEISAPEGGEWKNASTDMCKAILEDSTLGSYFTSLDNHSYWSDAASKRIFAAYFNRKYPNISLRCSEWCEMVNGRDTTMDSAINLAKQIHEDMTILDCVSWQYWIAVSCYDYRDGLIYVDSTSRKVTVPKRLWSMGNFSRFIDRGYERVELDLDVDGVSASAYAGVNEDGGNELVVVLINENAKTTNVGFSGLDTSVYSRISVNVTDKSHNLSETYYGEFLDGTAVEVPGQSVTTIVISEAK